MMQLACVAASTDRGVAAPRWVANTREFWLQMENVSVAAGGELQWYASNEEQRWLSSKNDCGERFPAGE